MTVTTRAACRLNVALLTLVSLVMLVPQARAARTVAVADAPHVIRTNHDGELTRLGPWNIVKDPSLGRANLLFGAPVAKVRIDEKWVTDCGRITQLDDGDAAARCYCEVRWESRRVGRVRARFWYEDQRRYERCSRTGVFSSFITGDESWATEDGLGVGQPTNAIRSLYPCAEFGGLSGLWNLTARHWYNWDPVHGKPGLDTFQWTWTTYAEPQAGQVKNLRAAIDSADRLEDGYEDCIRANG